MNAIKDPKLIAELRALEPHPKTQTFLILYMNIVFIFE